MFELSRASAFDVAGSPGFNVVHALTDFLNKTLAVDKVIKFTPLYAQDERPKYRGRHTKNGRAGILRIAQDDHLVAECDFNACVEASTE
jgi:hypothetical protein